MKRINLCLAFYLLVVKALCAEPSQNAFEKASYFLDNHQFSTCAKYIEKYLSENNGLDEQSTSLKLLIGKAYLRNHQLLNAQQTSKKILSKKYLSVRESFSAYQILIQAYILSSQYQVANTYLNQSKRFLSSNNLSRNDLVLYYLNSASLSFLDDSMDQYNFYLKGFAICDSTSSLMLDVHRGLGVKLVIDGEYDSGLYHINLGLELQKRYQSTDTVALVRLNLQKAYTFYRLGKIKQSISLFEEVIKPTIFRRHDVNEQVFNFLKTEFYRLSIITHSYIGDFRKTIEYSNKFLKEAPLFYPKDHFRFGEVYREIASAYLSVKKISKYLEFSKKSISILNHKKSYSSKVLFYRIQNSWVARNYDSSFYWSSRYLENNLQKTSREYLQAKQLQVLSLMNLEKYETAMEEISEVLLNSERDMNTSSFLATFYSLYLQNLHKSKIKPAEIPKELNFLEKIEDLISLCIVEKKNSRFHPEFIRLYNARNLYELDFGSENDLSDRIRHSLSLNCIDCTYRGEVLVGIDKSRHLNEMIVSNYLMAKNYLKLDSLNENGDHLEKALQYLRNSHQLEKMAFNDDVSDRSVNDKAYLTEFRSFIDEQILKVLFIQNKRGQKNATQIFDLIESQKETILTDNLKDKVVKQDLILPDSLSLRIRSIEEQIKYLKERINSYPDHKKSQLINSWKYSLQIAEQDLEILSFNTEIKSLRSKSLNKKDDILVNLPFVQKRLQKKELLLHYYESNENMYVLAVSAQNTEFLKLSLISDKLVSNLRENLDPSNFANYTKERFEEFTRSAGTIYEIYLEPVLSMFPDAEKLYVIPDGKLYHIPIETLIREIPQEQVASFKKLDYLIRDYTISYGGSATTLLKTKSLLNQLKPSSNKLLAFAPSYEPVEDVLLAKRESKKQPLSQLRDKLANLQWNDKEVESIGQYFEGEFFIAEKAHEQDFKNKANQYDILHLSMHAIVDAEDPMYSYLAFAPDPQDTTTGDGFLHAFEIYDMDLNSEMAVLSACNTGNGKLYKGEGPMSLAKAFIYAGCPSVVMSHWPADDRSSSQIMATFYQNLAKGMKKDEALRHAKLSFLENASPIQQSPTYWNNFVVMGDVSPIVKDQTMTYVYLLGTILVFFGLVWIGFLLVLMKRKRMTKSI